MSDHDAAVPVVVQTHVDKKRMMLAIALAAAALVCSVMTLLIHASQPKPPLVISVSIKTLLEEHMVTTIGQNISQSEAEIRTSEYVTSIESAIADLTSDESVIVVASEAVLGPNVPDFTGDVRLMARERAEALAARRGASLPAFGDQSGMTQMLDRMAADTADLRQQLIAIDQNASAQGEAQ
ncbi:MAG: TrbI F-type domain-containing protein [Pseudomonadota bacterium]